jgi:alkanesulfonate monooxygenase SsuD/methylene tetrahydromethanopterin reductase-like flavin-dependent oxidoreductase (luciferase family)
LGWSADEFAAAGASQKERGARADEFLAVLKTIWTEDPVEFHGKYFAVPRSIIGAKPVQKPHPPIYLAAYAPAALKRAASLANGWMPVGIPLNGMAAMIAQMRQMAKTPGATRKRSKSSSALTLQLLHNRSAPIGRSSRAHSIK